MKSYVVIGLGRFGTQIASKLYEHGQDVLAVDLKEDLVNSMAERVTRAAVADAKDAEALRSLGVPECDCAVVGIGSNLAASVLITMNLKNLQVKHVVCKAHDETHREILEKLGADEVIIPEHVVAEQTARTLTSPNTLRLVELSGDYGIIERVVPEAWIGKTLRELNTRDRYSVAIVAVREGEQVKVSPSADFKLREGATVSLLGDYDAMDRVQRLP